MPANLPPPYFEAEKRYREARTSEEKLEALEEMLTIMPKHKGTDKLRADLRRRIAKVKEQSQLKKGGVRRDTAFAVEREGAAQVVLVGPPNTGKSSLVATLTNASPEVAHFPHSTWKPTPGMALYENVQFQLVDTPPVTRERIDPGMADLLRRADILALVLDLQGDPISQLEDTVSILRGLRIYPQGWPIPDDLRKPPFIKKTFIVVNKVDDKRGDEDFTAFLELAEVKLPSLPVSVATHRGLMEILRTVYELSGIIRVYTKAPGKEPNLQAPFVLPVGSTLEELAGRIHKDFVSRMKFAKIWGTAVFGGQMVQKDHVLRDGDVVEIHI
ncbi:MAG: TGS domain-containing protein [Deltaproteobacteria bacterium]|nr:TGS domain-containing protein [Deltaproteobacteria bacterium]